MKDQSHTKYWISRFESDSQHGKKRFKKLNIGYPRFDIDETLMDVVELDEFIKIEDQRIPLFIGSQFGIHPRIDEMPDFFNGEKIIAILGKSLLSGTVAGLTLYQIQENEVKFAYNRIIIFKN